MTQCMSRTVYLFSIEDAWLTSGVGFNAANVVNIRGAQGGHETVKRHLRNKRSLQAFLSKTRDFPKEKFLSRKTGTNCVLDPQDAWNPPQTDRIYNQTESK